MKKIPTLFQRDPDNMARVLPEVHPACLWVLNGEGWPTRKLDGMCCAFVDIDLARGIFVRRREVKKGKPVPEDFVLVETDETTGKSVGWVPVGSGPEDAYFIKAFSRFPGRPEPGTYELVGPKSQGGVEGYAEHTLIAHHDSDLRIQEEVPRDFDGLRDWLEGKNIEGIVWHHPDGRMAKIKGRDFGHVRPKP